MIVLLLIALTCNRLPWRTCPAPTERFSGQDPEPATDRNRAAARPAPDAYAESP